MDKAELRKLQDFLRQSFGNDEIKLAPARQNPDDAEVQLGQRQIGTIVVDDEDGDRSFALRHADPGRAPGAAGLSSSALRQ